jgi:hypothetical protein
MQNIKVDPTEIWYEVTAKDRKQWKVFVNKVMNLHIPYKQKIS